MRNLNLSPKGGPGKKKNTITKNTDDTVSVVGDKGNELRLTEEGQDAILRKKFKYNDEPYLDKYGASYADKEGFEAKGASNISYKDGYVNFKDKSYNADAQHSIMNKLRGLPQNKGKDLYLRGKGTKYSAPDGYEFTRAAKLNPLKSVK